MPKSQFWIADWKHYDIGNPAKADKLTIMNMTRKAAKTANQRLRRLEQKGYLYTAAYRLAKAELGDRNRFYEYRPRLEKMSREELLIEYKKVIGFISQKTSTIQGIKADKASDNSRFSKAQEQGFTGSYDDWVFASNRYYAKLSDAGLSSEVITELIISEDYSIMEEIIKNYEESSEETKKSGELLRQALKRIK